MKKLYVGNLPFQATEEDISNWVKQAGATVANLSLVTDKFTGQPRGFAFVEINNDEEAARVIQSLNGQDFMGRNVVVNEARPREAAVVVAREPEAATVAVAVTEADVVVEEVVTRYKFDLGIS